LTSNRQWSELAQKSGVCPVDPKLISSGFIACVLNEKSDSDSSETSLSAIIAPKAQK
jgi:hypothetical protein